MPVRKAAPGSKARPPAPARATRPLNDVHVLVSHPRGARWKRTLESLAVNFLRTVRRTGKELSIALVSDGAIQTLNRTWRKKDRPTDVLSFPAGALPRGTPKPHPLGDVVISLDTAARRAREEGAELQRELALYLAHGLLHLLGYDHRRPDETRTMARWERKLLGSAGMLERTPRGAGAPRK
jgi:probable rRNA maturation factor